MTRAPRRAAALAGAFAGNRRASMIITFALTLPVLLGAGSFALDMGSVYLDQRSLQTATDAAALAAAEHPAQAEALARHLLDVSGHRNAVLGIAFGAIDADPTADREGRFTAGAGDAVRVTTKKTGQLYLAQLFHFEAPSIEARSDARLTPIVSLSAGGRLASADPRLVNQLVGPLFGSSVQLSLVDCRALARSTIGFGDLLAALGAQGPGRAKTVGASLARPVAAADLLRAASSVLDRSGDGAGGAVLRQLGQRLGSATGRVALGDLLATGGDVDALEIAYPGRALAARISALGLVSALFDDRAVGNRLEATLVLPGLAEVRIAALLGEPERRARSVAVGEAGATGATGAVIQTAQLRLRAQLSTKGLLDGIGAGVALPVELVAAGGTARVVSATCGASPAEREVRVAVEPGLFRLSIGAFSRPLEQAGLADRPAPAEIVSAPLLKVSASATIAARRRSPVILRFGAAEIGTGAVKTVRTTGIAGSLVASLFDEIELTARPLGIPAIPISLLTRSVASSLSALAAPLDAVLGDALAALGLGLGEMDVAVDDLVCRQARIVG